MKFKYRNDTDGLIFYRDDVWGRGDERETAYPVPSSLRLTCIQEGDTPDPVLFHDDIVMGAGEEKLIKINAPFLSRNIYLTIFCMSEGGVECRFNSSKNKPIPIDARSFSQKMDWTLCSKIFLKNPLDMSVQISITALEVAE